jgi:hypothetical protein
MFADETQLQCSIPAAGAPDSASCERMCAMIGRGAAPDPPGVVYLYAPDRMAEQPISYLAGFKGITAAIRPADLSAAGI